MSKIDSLVIEHLRHIRGRVDEIAEDVTEIKHRMTSLEGSMSLVKREVHLATRPMPGNH